MSSRRRRKRGRAKHQLRQFKTRLDSRIASWQEIRATGDFQGYTFHKPGSQNRNK